MDGLPPRDREDSSVLFVAFGVTSSGLILNAERVGEVSAAHFHTLLANAGRTKGILAARQQRMANTPLQALAWKLANRRIARQSAANAVAYQSERFSRSPPLRWKHGGGPTVQQAHGFFVDSTLPVPARVLLCLGATGALRATLGEYTCAAEGVLDGLPPETETQRTTSFRFSAARPCLDAGPEELKTSS